MKRTRTIVADDGYTKITVTVKLASTSLTQYEAARSAGHIAGGVMTAIVAAPYISCQLADVRVK